MRPAYYRISIVLFLLSVTLSSARAEGGIYTWKDDAGVTHYSSKPVDKRAKAAELPEIVKGEVKLVPEGFKVESCDTRGGVDCRAGPDNDGSVICSDGFRDSTVRFRFSCSSPRLSVASVSLRRPDGSFTVTVRNSKSVVARKVRVEYRPGDGLAAGVPTVALVGPADIEPLGTGDYTYSLGRDPEALTSLSADRHGKLDPGRFEVSCENC